MITIIVTSIILLCVGYIGNFYKLKKISDDIAYSNTFKTLLNKYINSNFKNVDICDSILIKSYKMQRIMGTFGIINSYMPPYENIIISRYEVITNLIQEINRIYLNFKEYPNNIIQLANNSIMLYIGFLTEHAGEIKSRLRNPIIILWDGIFIIFNIPLHALERIGIITNSVYENIKNNILYKLLIFIFSIIGLYSNIITIVDGHTSFIESIFK